MLQLMIVCDPDKTLASYDEKLLYFYEKFVLSPIYVIQLI